MHLLRADLDLDDAGLGRHDGGVERLVAVTLREGDKVFESARQRVIERVDDAERLVAVLEGRHHDTERGDVVDLRDVIALPQQLLVETPEALETRFGAKGESLPGEL